MGFLFVCWLSLLIWFEGVLGILLGVLGFFSLFFFLLMLFFGGWGVGDGGCIKLENWQIYLLSCDAYG